MRVLSLSTLALAGVATLVLSVACSSSSTTTAAPSGDDGGSSGTSGGNPPPPPGDGGSSGAPPGTPPPPPPPASACSATAAELTVHACTGNLLVNGDVPAGCAPTVDGTLHGDEWADAACFDVVGDMAVYVKFAGDALYMATIGNPSCGCGMPFFFEPSGATTLGADAFAVSVFDDPFMTNGDRSDFVYQGGAFEMGAAPAGIVTSCKGGQPTPIAYEWKLPFSALGITAGGSHKFRMAIVHAQKKWPTALTVDGSGMPNDPTNWGVFQSQTYWR